MEEYDKRVTAMYNDCWKLYRDYTKSHDMRQFNEAKDAVIEKYGRQKTLEGMINRYEDLLHKNWDLATDEQKARILQIKANTERMKSSGNNDGEDGVVIVNDAPTGEDIRHSNTEVPVDI